MTANRRIFLNIVATYGRSLYALVIGLFCGRWTLMALGEVDYGLMGVVGGLAGFVAFVNSLLSSAVSRFFAFSVGVAMKADDRSVGIEDCRKWFSTAVALHTTFAIVLVIVGYPIGVYAICHFLTIPADRIEACIWVWRFTCITCFVGMFNVPYRAMYTAKQEIAELTIYGFVTSTLNVSFMYYAIMHPGTDWLVRVSAWMCFLSVVPQLIICVRSLLIFDECRIKADYLWNAQRLKDIFCYAGSRFITMLAFLLNSNGMTILVNKLLGPAKNAAMSLGNTVAGHSMTLSGAFMGALTPAVTNAAGARQLDRMRQLAFYSCTLSTVAVLIFALPLFLEIQTVMVLWLKNPPSGASELCCCMLLVAICDHLTAGHSLSILALGRIAKFNLVESASWFSVLPVAYVLMRTGWGIVGAGMALVFAKVLAIFVKLYFGQQLAGLSVRYWLARILFPLSYASGAALLVGLLPVYFFDRSFGRVVMTTFFSECVFLLMIWFVVLCDEERQVVLRSLRKFFRWIH